MPWRRGFWLLAIVVFAGSFFCACESDCCRVLLSSSAPGGGSSPFEGPNCPCAASAEFGQEGAVDFGQPAMAEDNLFSRTFSIASPPAESEGGLQSPPESDLYLFVVHHQLVI